MISFIIRRTLYAIPVLLGVAFLTVVLFHVAMGDPAKANAGKGASPQLIDQKRVDMGLAQEARWCSIETVNEKAVSEVDPVVECGRTYCSEEEDGVACLRDSCETEIAALDGSCREFVDETEETELDRFHQASLSHMPNPLFVQYKNFLVETATLNLGRSWITETPVTEIFLRGIGPTLSLSIPAFILGSLLAIALSLLVAYFRGRPIDRMVTTAAIAGISVSSLVYILFGQWLLAGELKLFPIWGFEYGPSAVFFLALPICIWILLSVGTDIRYYRTVALEEINQDYVRTARAKGLSEPVILFKHVLRNCSVPIITRMTIAIPFLIMGAFLLEIFFGIPGLGSVLYVAIFDSDFPVIKAFTMMGAILYVIFNILADVLYAYFDPRIRLS